MGYRSDFGLQPPDEPELREVDELFCVPEPLHWTAEKRALMVRACRAMALYHKARCPELGRIYARQGFDPEGLRDEAGLERIPPLGVWALKRFCLSSKDPSEALVQRTSSGTDGRPTKVWRDAGTCWRLTRMGVSIWEQSGLISETPTNYLIFAYEPNSVGEEVNIVHYFHRARSFAPALDTFYAVQRDAAGRWELQKEQAAAKLRAYADAGRPVRILGLPALIYETLLHMEARGPVRLPPESWVLTSGGWKAYEDRSVSREAFRDKISRLWGLPVERIRDRYGMVEHGVPYDECRLHRFHIPVYGHVLVRDPLTLEALPPGKAGLLELISPANSMMPHMAILSADMGAVDPAPCACGLRSPTFALLGRGGLVLDQTCALRMEDLLSRPKTS